MTEATASNDLLTGSALEAAAITKSDATVLSIPKAIYVGTGGTVSITTRGGTTVTFTNVPDGSILPIRPQKVLSTGTSASDMIALY